VTSPVRTVLDNARDRDLEELLANAFAATLVNQRQIDRVIARFPTFQGVGRLQALLRQDGGVRRTRSWGYEFHRDRDSFENDRARDATLVAAGYRVIRFTATQLDEQPLVVITRLAAALALASATCARPLRDVTSTPA
jgi:hypothetical protein